MKKDESSVTMEERREAKRRIQGSLTPDLDMDRTSDPTFSGRLDAELHFLTPPGNGE